MIATGSASHLTPPLLMVYNGTFAVLELGLLFYHLRKIKYERVHNLIALVESRRQYLRYVSHEVRVCLNS